jgi:hypothetical protein
VWEDVCRFVDEHPADDATPKLAMPSDYFACLPESQHIKPTLRPVCRRKWPSNTKCDKDQRYRERKMTYSPVYREVFVSSSTWESDSDLGSDSEWSDEDSESVEDSESSEDSDSGGDLDDDFSDYDNSE